MALRLSALLVAVVPALAAAGATAVLVRGEPVAVGGGAADGAAECEICKLVVSEVGSLLADNATETKLTALLVNDVCPLLPSEIAASCAMLAPTLIPGLVSTLEKKLPTLCASLNLCTSGARAPRLALAGVRGSAECSICKYVASYVEGVIASNTTEGKAEADLNQLCDHLPGELGGTCHDYVTAYTGVVFQLIEQAQPPEVVCAELKACASSGRPAFLAAANDDCDTCEFVLDEVQSLLSDNATVAEIVSWLDNECSQIAGSLASECSALVEQYGPEAMAYVAAFIDPDTDCQKLGLCPTAGGAAKERRVAAAKAALIAKGAGARAAQ